MPTQRDYSVKLLLNSVGTTTITTGSAVDLGASPSIAKRECKVILLASTNRTLDATFTSCPYQLQENTTSASTGFTDCYTADTTAVLSTGLSVAPVEVHYWVTKRYVRMMIPTAPTTGGTGASVLATIQVLNRSV